MIEKYLQPTIMPMLTSVLSVDCVLFGFENGALKVLLIERNEPPYENWWALPGNLVDNNENLDDAAQRILQEVSGFKNVFMEQYYTFGDVGRHPQGRVASIAYYAILRLNPHLKKPEIKSKYFKKAEWCPVDQLPDLGFDHLQIIQKGLEKVKRRIKYLPIAFELLPEKFTLTQVQSLYEVIWDKKMDKRNFRKKIMSLGILKELNEKQKGVSNRAAMLYKFDRRKYMRLYGQEMSF